MGTSIQAFFINRSAPITVRGARARFGVHCLFRQTCRAQVLFSHGNAEDLSTIYHYFKEFAKAVDVNILAYDYTGYGKNRGEPSEAHVCADIEAAWKHLIETRKMRPNEVVLYGRSVGSGATCYLAQKLSIEGSPPGACACARVHRMD